MIFLLLVILIVIKNFSLIYTAALRVTPPTLLQKLTDGNNRSRYWY